MDTSQLKTFESVNRMLSPETLDRKRQQVIEDLKKSMALRMLYSSPKVSWVEKTNQALSEWTSLSPEMVSEYVLKFLEVGLWKTNAEGQVEFDPKVFYVGQTGTKAHITASLEIMANLRESGPCWYESVLVVTNTELKKNFYKKVYDALKELYDKSVEAKELDAVIAWSHQGYDCKTGLNNEFIKVKKDDKEK